MGAGLLVWRPWEEDLQPVALQEKWGRHLEPGVLWSRHPLWRMLLHPYPRLINQAITNRRSITNRLQCLRYLLLPDELSLLKRLLRSSGV